MEEWLKTQNGQDLAGKMYIFILSLEGSSYRYQKISLEAILS